MNKPVVVVADPMHEAGMDMLRKEFDVHTLHADDGECPEILKRAQAIVVRTYQIPASIIKQCANLKAIVKHGAGVDNIDIASATERGIIVANTGDANAQSVAELAVTLMLSAARNTVALHHATVSENYKIRWGLLLESIFGKTLGIIGFGNIGRRVAAICRNGFEMQVLAFDPYKTSEEIAASGARKVDVLAELLPQSDVISVNSGLAEDSKYLLGEHEFTLMKPSAIVVNTARGGVIDEKALARALVEKRIYGAGLDVFEDEPPRRGNPLFDLDNVVLSPHVGGATVGARVLMSTRAAEAVIAVLNAKPPEFWLNPDAIPSTV